MPTLRKKNKKNKKIKLSKTKLKKGGVHNNNVSLANTNIGRTLGSNNNNNNNRRNVNKVFNVLSSHQAANGEFSGLSPENLSRLDLTRRNSNRRTIIHNAMANRVLPHNIQKFMEEFLGGGQCNIRIGAERYTIDSISTVTVHGIRTHDLAINWPHGNTFTRQYIGSFTHPVHLHTGPELIPNEELENFIKDLFRNDGEIEYWDNGWRWARYIR